MPGMYATILAADKKPCFIVDAHRKRAVTEPESTGSSTGTFE